MSAFVAAQLALGALLTAPRLPRTAGSVSMLASVDGPGWPQLQAELDRLPAFCVANKEGQPLQYEIYGKPAGVFFADVDAAKAELAAARAEAAADGGATSSPSASARPSLTTDNSAMLVPGKAELKAAGAPPDADPRGQQLPLFACMEMSGRGRTARDPAALHVPRRLRGRRRADTEADNPDEALEIVGLSLDSVVERLSASDGEPAFTFVPPSSSTAFIDAYLENSGGTAHSVGGGACGLARAANTDSFLPHAARVASGHADSPPRSWCSRTPRSQREVGLAAAAEGVRQLRQLQVALLEALED